MIDKASEQERPALQKKRKESVPVHMREGAKMARAKLVELNRQMPVFSAQDIDAICDIIAIHDAPKLNLKIPRDNLMAAAFREADRLWMVTPAGVRSDLARKQKKDPTVDPDDPNEQLAQARHSIERFKEERTISLLLVAAEGVFMVGVGYAPTLGLACGLWLLIGLGAGFGSLNFITLTQQRVAKDLMGRFMSLIVLTEVGLTPISNALAGVLADLNVTMLFVGAGMLLTLTALLAAMNSDLRPSEA